MIGARAISLGFLNFNLKGSERIPRTLAVLISILDQIR